MDPFAEESGGGGSTLPASAHNKTNLSKNTKRKIGYFMRVGIYLGCVVTGAVVISFEPLVNNEIAASCGEATGPCYCFASSGSTGTPPDCEDGGSLALLPGFNKDAEKFDKYGFLYPLPGCFWGLGDGKGALLPCNFILITAIVWMLAGLFLGLMSWRAISGGQLQPKKTVWYEFFLCAVLTVWVFICALVITISAEVISGRICGAYTSQAPDRDEDMCSNSYIRHGYGDVALRQWTSDKASAKDGKHGWNAVDGQQDGTWAAFVFWLVSTAITYSRYQRAKLNEIMGVEEDTYEDANGQEMDVPGQKTKVKVDKKKDKKKKKKKSKKKSSSGGDDNVDPFAGQRGGSDNPFE